MSPSIKQNKELIKKDCGCEYYQIILDKTHEDRLYIGYCDEHLPDKEGEFMMKVELQETKEVIVSEYWKKVEKEKCELEGPYECPSCGGHIMLDATYLDQVEIWAVCPYCDAKNHVRKGG